MGCCLARETDAEQNEHAKAKLAQTLHDEFDVSRPLIRRGAVEPHGETDLAHFSHSFALNNDKKIDDVYTMDISELGRGVAGTVRKAVDKSTKAVRAVKIINPKCLPEHGMRALKNEVGLMRMLDHPHIVKLYEVFHDTSIYLVMELCSGGELFDAIIKESSFSEHRASGYMKQIFGAVFYLHKHAIVHRDLKPENLILQDTSPDALIKLIDFGIAAKMSPGKALTQRVGTTSYVAPEVLLGEYNHKVDVWSCGVICYILLSGCPPFDMSEEAHTRKNIRKARYEFTPDPWDNVSEDAKNMIKSIFTLSAEDRPEASELLQHSWIQKEAELQKKPLQQGIIQNFKAYNHSRKMKQIALALIATQFQQSELDKLRQQFEALDTNGDGMLSKEELAQGVDSLNMTAADKEELMKIDSDGSGEIDWTEFVAAALDRETYQTKDVLWSAFCAFDIDGDGQITKSELKTILEAGNGTGIDESKILELIADGDSDGDGCISFEEFCQMMTSTSFGDTPEATPA